MSTIFLSVYDADTERVILRTRVFRELKASGNRIVLLIRGAERLEYYRTTFADERVLVELLPKASSLLEQFWYFIGWSSIPTHAAAVRRRREFAANHRVFRYLVSLKFWLLGHIRPWRELLRALYQSTGEDYAIELFKKYQPDLLFAPNMFSAEDLRLLRMAKKLGIPSVTTAKSWDVLVTKAFTRVRADRLIVFNEYNRDEAIRYGDYRPEQIIVSGFPQFDIYKGKSILLPRENFFKRIGVDPNKQLVLFGIPGDWKSPASKDILIALDEAIEKGELTNVAILGRLHPKYGDRSEDATFKHVVMERPGHQFSSARDFAIDSGVRDQYAWRFDEDDTIHLANSLYHSDVVIVTDSTLALDATAMGKPVVIIGYDGTRTLPYWRSIASIYERDHYRNLLALGATPLVKSNEQLLQTLQEFLRNPEYLRRERDLLARSFLFANDGSAGERMGQGVLELLKGKD